MRKKFLIFLGGLIISLLSQGQELPAAVEIWADSSQLDMKSEDRPSCEMLAWRWVMTLSRMSEAEGVKNKALLDKASIKELAVMISRQGDGHAEGGNDLVVQRLIFKSSEIRPEDFKWDIFEGAGLIWKNTTPNITDRIRINVKEGEIVVETDLPYENYCFHQGLSKIKGSLKGEPIELIWKTKSINLNGYLKLIQTKK
jgi:hypothetical protein